MIGVTGATGRLGSKVLDLIPDALSIGRRIPTDHLSAIIHCAVSKDPHALDGFNLALRQYCNLHKPKLVIVGSCWQLLAGDTYDLEYSVAKRKQSRLFAEATEVVPFWIFGEGKGFIWQVVQAVKGEVVLESAGLRERDFVWVNDVARDLVTALDCTGGMVGSYTDRTIRPAHLAEHFGLSVDWKEPFPSTILEYGIPQLGDNYRSAFDWVAEKIREN